MDFAKNHDGRESTSGHVFLFGGGAVSRSSKKNLSRHTMRRYSIAVTQAVWIKRFVERLMSVPKG